MSHPETKMGANSKTRREQKKAKEETRQKKREQKRLTQGTPQLESLSDSDLLAIFPAEEMSRAIGARIDWKVRRLPEEIQAQNLEAYNTCATTDIYFRARGTPPERHPLHRYYASYCHRTDYARAIGYRHNQVLVGGRASDDTCALLHIAGTFPTTLYLHEIELANPNAPVIRPLFRDQRHPGIGHGVFKYVLENLANTARNLGFDKILAYAADEARAQIFERRGFHRDDSDVRLASIASSVGHQIPIALLLLPSAARGDQRAPTQRDVGSRIL